MRKKFGKLEIGDGFWHRGHVYVKVKRQNDQLGPFNAVRHAPEGNAPEGDARDHAFFSDNAEVEIYE